MDSYVSLTDRRYFFSNLENIFTIPVSKSGTANCSVSVFLADSSSLHPSGIQYVGIEQVLLWQSNEEGIKYANFHVLPTAHRVEYVAVGLKNFLRCLPQNISQAIAAIGEPNYLNYPTIFGGYVTLTSDTMQREVILQDGVYTTTYTFPLPDDAILGDVRTKDGISLPYVYKQISHRPNWQAIIAIMDDEPVEDASLQIHVVAL